MYSSATLPTVLQAQLHQSAMTSNASELFKHISAKLTSIVQSSSATTLSAAASSLQKLATLNDKKYSVIYN